LLDEVLGCGMVAQATEPKEPDPRPESPGELRLGGVGLRGMASGDPAGQLAVVDRPRLLRHRPLPHAAPVSTRRPPRKRRERDLRYTPAGLGGAGDWCARRRKDPRVTMDPQVTLPSGS